MCESYKLLQGFNHTDESTFKFIAMSPLCNVEFYPCANGIRIGEYLVGIVVIWSCSISRKENEKSRFTANKLMILSDEEKMARYAHEERQVREENLRLQRKLQLEIERREALCRTLSESESSLEMDDERFDEQSFCTQ